MADDVGGRYRQQLRVAVRPQQARTWLQLSAADMVPRRCGATTHALEQEPSIVARSGTTYQQCWTTDNLCLLDEREQNALRRMIKQVSVIASLLLLLILFVRVVVVHVMMMIVQATCAPHDQQHKKYTNAPLPALRGGAACVERSIGEAIKHLRSLLCG